MKKIKFSIIIPAYNAEKTIKSCVDSVLAQDYDSYEIIIVDDGSKDATSRILRKEYGDNKKITILSQENKGVSAARNRALKAASGEWVIFLDSDDKIIPGAFKNLDAIAQASKIDIIVTRLIIDGTDNTVVEDVVLDDNKSDAIERLIFCEGVSKKSSLDYFPFRCPGGKIVRKSLIDDNGIVFPDGIHNFEDGIFLLSCFLSSRRVICSGYSFYYYDLPSGTYSRTNGIYNNVIDENKKIFGAILNTLDKANFDSSAINKLALVLLIPSLDSSLSLRDRKERRKTACDLFRFYSNYCEKASFSGLNFSKKIELLLVKAHLKTGLITLLKLKHALLYGGGKAPTTTQTK